MAKDPAFLFYSKDWLEGTAEMTPAEKGVYIDLLAHQHQKGSLPSDISRLCKLAGLGQEEFTHIWSHLNTKFVETTDNRLVNRKLTDIVTDRSTKSLTNKITGTLAAVIRLQTGVRPEIKEKIKKLFNVNDFITVPTDSLTVSITEWFQLRLKSIENANANTNANTDSIEIGGMGERGWNFKPTEKDIGLALPEIKCAAVIELFQISKSTTITKKQVESLWMVFKKQNFNGTKFYEDAADVHRHFINWSKNQTINGTEKHQRGHGGRAVNLTEPKSESDFSNL